MSTRRLVWDENKAAGRMLGMGIAENLKRLRKEAGLSQPALARASGVSQQLISQLERGENVTTTRLPDLARALSASLDELDESYAGLDLDRKVRLVGYVGAGDAAHYYAVSQGDLGYVRAPEGATGDTVAVEIRGGSLGTVFDGWFIYFDEVRDPPTLDMLGTLCVVGLDDDRVLVKKLRSSRKAGRFNLESNIPGDPLITDVRVLWAAQVKDMKPKHEAQLSL